MIFYKPGTQFLFNDEMVSVDFVIIRKMSMMVRLRGYEQACKPEDLIPLPETPGHAQWQNMFSNVHKSRVRQEKMHQKRLQVAALAN